MAMKFSVDMPPSTSAHDVGDVKHRHDAAANAVFDGVIEPALRDDEQCCDGKAVAKARGKPCHRFDAKRQCDIGQDDQCGEHHVGAGMADAPDDAVCEKAARH